MGRSFGAALVRLGVQPQSDKRHRDRVGLVIGSVPRRVVRFRDANRPAYQGLVALPGGQIEIQGIGGHLAKRVAAVSGGVLLLKGGISPPMWPEVRAEWDHL